MARFENAAVMVGASAKICHCVLYFEHEISRQRFVHVERMSRYFDRMKISFNLIRYTLHTIIIYKNLVIYENLIRVWFNKLI